MLDDDFHVGDDQRRWASGMRLAGPDDLNALALPLRLTCDGEFEARLWTGRSGPMIFVRYDGVRVRAERTAQHLGDNLSGHVMLTVVLRGHWKGFQGGREFNAVAGEAMATRFDQTFQLLTTSADSDTLGIYIPLPLFDTANLSPDAVAGGSWKLANLTISAVEFVTSALADSSKNSPTRAARLDGMMVRIAMLILDDFPTAAHDSGLDRDDIRTQVRDVIDTDFRDPLLNSDTIAERLNISPRSLFRAFEKSDVTVNQLIRNTRLDRAAAELAGQGSTRTIAAIAHSHGFSGADTFSRAFRLRFDESPSQFRRRINSSVTT
ncbi:helix-turn-helix domain-containing protein [Jongsikchunia kroppenstedtii]|uniref:helix-turn-helix domain-containing protein n=1 Tax=Jongsikchunia kroppenstedtii TaxID=1121721 RepID=UPI0003815C4E|nr:helix-turn-helix domain-containing protein [Jongsikchunia kroppenstedtii]